MVLFTSIGLETPRFFQFELVSNGTHTDYWTTDLMEEPTYIQFSAYWDVLITKGGVPLLALIYFNLCMILKIRASSKFSHRFVGRKTSGMNQRAGTMHGGHAGGHGHAHRGGGSGHGGSTRSRNYSVALCRDEFLSSGPPTEMIALRHHGSLLSKAGSPHCRSNLLSPLSFREKEKVAAGKVKPETGAAMLEEGEDMLVEHVKVRQHGKEWPPPEDDVEVVEVHGLIGEDEDDGEEDDPAAGATRPLTKLSRSLSSTNTTPSRLSCGGGNLVSGSISRKPTKNASNHFQKRREKSTLILVLIVLIFIACHSYRLSLKIYEFSNPENNTEEHFLRCTSQGRYHIPVVFYVLVHIHHLVLVLNSSINFIIYCCVGKEFRMKLVGLFCREKNPVIVW